MADPERVKRAEGAESSSLRGFLTFMQIDNKTEVIQRALFPSGGQKTFLEQAAARIPKSWKGLAALCQVHTRTLCDWRREKYTMSADALAIIRRQLKIDPGLIRVAGQYRHLRQAGGLGARARYRLYGNPGTAEGRRKGGQITCQRFEKNKNYARRVGFVIKKPIRKPAHSRDLAEFIGVVLGDGSLSDYQLAIYFNSRDERPFARYVQSLIRNLFDLRSTLTLRQRNCLAVVASGKSLVDFLHTMGLRTGDKIASKVDVPKWIFKRVEFQKACLRGFMDTDGCVFFHNHRSRGHRYRHIGLSFTSYSPVLLRSVNRLFLELGFGSKIYPKNGHVSLFRRDEVGHYMIDVGTRNPKHLRRFQSYSDSKVG